jgi:hypothetical protein
MSETVQTKSPQPVAFEVEVKSATPLKKKTPIQTRLESPRPKTTPEQIKQRYAEAQQRRAVEFDLILVHSCRYRALFSHLQVIRSFFFSIK